MDDYSISERCYLAREDLKEVNERLETVTDWIPADDVGLGGLEDEVYQEHRDIFHEAEKFHNEIRWKLQTNELVGPPEGIKPFEEELSRAEKLIQKYGELFE